jgi:hypothetical protein
MDEPALNAHIAQVATAILKGNVTPLLGAGVNLTTRNSHEPWKEHNQIKFLPNGSELAEHLAEEFRHRDMPQCETPACTVKDLLPRPDLIKVSQAVEVQQGELPLLQSPNGIFRSKFPLSQTHRFLARFPDCWRTNDPKCGISSS